MSRILKVSGDNYRIVTSALAGGTITLDTGNQIGKVVVTGDLEVLGDTTTVESETLTIKDNTIYLNVGETNAGITLGIAGFWIERGTLPDAGVIFDETISHNPSGGASVPGTFKLVNGLGNLVGLRVNSISTGSGDLNISTGVTGSGVISVAGVPNYESRVTDDDDIPNKKYLDEYVSAIGGSALVDRVYRFVGVTQLNTGLRTFDTDAGDDDSKIIFEVDGSLKIEVDNDKTQIGLVQISDNVITTANSNLNLTSDNFRIEIEGSVSLSDQTFDPLSELDKNIIYSKAEQSTGGTGIYFKNPSSSGELVSATKALVYSLIF
jgi:hypothetical protein